MYWKYEIDQEIWQPKEKKVRKERKKQNKKRKPFEFAYFLGIIFVQSSWSYFDLFMFLFFGFNRLHWRMCVCVCVRV